MASTMECNIREEEEESWSDLSDLSEFEDEEVKRHSALLSTSPTGLFDDPISIRNSTLPKDIFTTSPPASSSSSSHSRNTANHSRSTAPAPSLPQQRDLSSHSMSLSSRSTSTSSQESLSSCSRSSSSAVFSSMSPSARSLPHPISSVSSLPSSSSRGHHQQQQQRRPHSMKRPSGSSVPHRPSSAASASGGSSAGTQSHRNSLDLPHHAARAPLLAFERPPSSSPQARPLSGGSASLSSLSLSAGGGAHAARPSTPTTRHATSSSPMPAYTSSSSSSSSSNSHKRAISHAQFSASRSTQASSSSSSGSPSRRSDHRRTRGAPDSPYANARSHSSATSSSSSGANALRLNVKQKSKSGRPGNLTPSNTLREEILSTFARPSALSSSAAGQPTPENSPTNAKYHYHSRSSSNSCSLTPAPAQLERTDSHPLQRELMKDKAAAVKSKLVDADVDADVRVRSVSPTPKQGDCTSRRASRSDRNKTSLLPNGISAADDPEHEQQPTGSRMRSDSELTQPDSLVASRQSTLSRTGNGSRTDTGSRGTEKLTESRVRAHNGAGGHDKAALGGLHRQTSTDTQASTSTVREEDFVEATSDPTLGVERASSFPAATSREGANTANTRSSAASLSRSSTRSKSKSLSRRATGTSSTTPPQAMEWTIDEVVRWLFSLGKSFEAYEDEFRHNGISGRCLLEDVNEATIGDLVHVKLHQARIMREIQILKGTYRPSSFVEGADASSPSSSSSSSSSSHPSSSSSHPSSSSSSSRKKQHRRTRSSSSGKLLKSPTYSKSRPTSAAGTSTNSATSPSTSATSTSSGGSATGTTKSRSRERSISPSFNSSSKRKHRSRRGSRTTSSASSSSTVASRQRSRRNSRNAAHPSRVAIPSNMGSAPSPSPSPTQAPSKPRGKFAHLRSRSSHQFNVRTPSQRRQHTNSHSFASPPPSLQIRQLSQRDVTNEGVGAELADRASASSSASHRSVKQRMRRRSSTALRSPSVILRGKSPSRSRSGINTDALIADFDASSPIVGAVSVDLKGKDDTPASSSSLKSKFKMRSPRLASASSRFAAVSGLSRISSAFRKSKSPRLDGGADTPEPSPATRPMMLRSRGNSIVSATSVDSTYLAQTSHDATSAAMEDDKFDLDSLSYGQLSRSYSNMSVTSTESGNSARGRAGSPSPTPGQGGGTSSAASRGGRPVPRLHAASQNFTGHGGRGRKPRLQRERTMHVSPTGSPSPHAVRHRRMQTQPALVRMSSVPVNARGSTATGQAAIDFLQQYHMPSSAATPGSSPRNIASLKRLKRSHPSSDAVQGFLEIPTARQYFKEYLKSRFAAENLLFWIECSDFEQLDFDQRVQRFKRILVTYLSHDASNQVSLPSQIQKDLLAVDPENPAADVFDVALKSVLRLLRMPFSEFLDSDEYKKYTQSASGRILLNAAASDYASSDQASDEGSIDSSRHKRYATVGHATLSHSRSNPSTLLHAFDEDGESKSEHDDPGSRSRSHDTAPGRTSSSDTLSAGAAPAVGKKKNREDWFDFLDAGIVPDKEHDEFLEIANKGQEVLKHGRRGAPNKRKLRVDMKKRALVYQRRTISFAQIAAIKDGKQSALYQTRAALQEIDEALCLSIYLDTSSQDKTIDLQFPSASTRDLWSRHLQRCIIDHEA